MRQKEQYFAWYLFENYAKKYDDVTVITAKMHG